MVAGMIDNDTEIKRLVSKLTELSIDAVDAINEHDEKMQKKLISKMEKAKRDASDRINKYEEEGMRLSNDAINKIRLNQEREVLKERMQSELAILQEISNANQKEREHENDILASKIRVQKAINSGNIDIIVKEKQALKAKETAHKKELLEAQKQENKKSKHSKEDKDEAILDKKQKRQQEKENQQQEGDAYEFGDLFRNSFSDFIKEVNEGNSLKKTSEENLLKGVKALNKSIMAGLDAVNNAISAYAKYQTSINSRLQGISSYAEAVNNLSSVAFSPLLKADDLYSNLSELVSSGVVTNVEQRAFFQTVKDGIAETFDVNADYLKRLIRVQQTDSTAARLGMEGYLNKFLNAFVENTEYLTTTFDNVAQSLLEASSLMTASDSSQFEFTVQK